MEFSKALKDMETSDPGEYRMRMELSKAQESGATPPPVFKAGRPTDRTKAFDTEKKTGEFRITQKVADRVGDVVFPEGMDNKDFRNNPVVLWCHDDWQPPIGRSLSETVDGDSVIGVAEFDAKSDLGMKVFDQFVDGYLNAVSIRFRPKKWRKIMEEQDQGEDVWTGGFEFEEWELLEYSPVPIPCHQGALALTANGVTAMAKAMGIRVETPDTELGRILVGSELLKAFPELTQDGGLKSLIVAAVREARGQESTVSLDPVDRELFKDVLQALKGLDDMENPIQRRQAPDVDLSPVIAELQGLRDDIVGAA